MEDADQALRIAERCYAPKTQRKAYLRRAELREWSHVLHSWHTFYPIMPKADAALKDISDFLRGHFENDK